MIVSVKSTEFAIPDDPDAVAGLWAGDFAAAVLAAGAWAAGALTASGFADLLEMTNLRRAGAVLIFGAFGLLLLPRGALFAALALRFNIKYQTKNNCAGSEIIDYQLRKMASDEPPAFLAVKLELRTPED